MTKRNEPEYAAEVVAQINLIERIPDRRFKSGYREAKQIGTSQVVTGGTHQITVAALRYNGRVRDIRATAQVSLGPATCWAAEVGV